MKTAKRIVSILLSAASIIAAPGLAPYQAAAQVVGPSGPAAAPGAGGLSGLALPIGGSSIKVDGPSPGLGTSLSVGLPGAAIKVSPVTGRVAPTASGIAPSAQGISLQAGPTGVPAQSRGTLGVTPEGKAAAIGLPASVLKNERKAGVVSKEEPLGPNEQGKSPTSQLNRIVSAVERPKDGASTTADETGARFSESFDGRKRLVVVGTSGSRPFILEESVKTAKALGVELILVDEASRRKASAALVEDKNFIPAPIDSHDPKVVEGILAQVAQAAGGKVDAVITFLNPYAELAGKLVDVFGARGNSGAAVEAAHTKSLAREAFSKIPEIATPYRVVTSADQAREAYAALGGGKFVMKPIHGGGSALVVVDIDSADKAAAVYREIEEGLEAFKSRADAGFFMLDQNPGIMMERQLEGPEVDVELVLEDGKVKFWHVSDNPPMDKPYAVEKGVTFPSQLPRSWQESLAKAAGLAVEALGLKTGNMHVELMATPEGPRVLEVNARMGGLFVWNLVKAVTGVNLVEQGVRSVLGLPVQGAVEPTIVLDARLIIPKATGTLEVLEGLEELAKEPGIERVVVMKKAGDAVRAAPDDSFDYLGYVTATGKTYAEAEAAVLAALAKVRVAIRAKDGTLVEQTGANAQEKVDMTGLLAPEVRQAPPEVMAKRERIMKGYLRGQLALIASFAMYYSLFSPVATALAGTAGMGQGRSGYAGALAIFKPIAGVLAERFSTRSILVGAFIVRAVIWALVLPAAFLMLGSGGAFLGTFVALMFLDGAVVSINSLVDIDEGGIDLLGQQHGFPVDDALRNRYNAILDGFYSASRVVMAPAMAALGLFAAGILNSAAAALVVVMALSFAVPAVFGAYQYLRYIPAEAKLPERKPGQTVGREVRDIAGNLWSGLKLAWTERKIRWRILFNAAERAIEDSMLFVVLAEFAMKILAPGDAALGALYTALLIAVGKLGAMAAAWAMHKYWKAPAPGEAKWPKYKVFFPLAFGGTLATVLIPVAAMVASAGSLLGAAAIAGLSAMLFNLLFAASSLGFRNLMQGIVSEAGASGRLFGIQGTLLMGVNAAVILALSALFAAAGLVPAFWIAAGLYAAYGLAQLVLGPRLLFPGASKKDGGAK